MKNKKQTTKHPEGLKMEPTLNSYFHPKYCFDCRYSIEMCLHPCVKKPIISWFCDLLNQNCKDVCRVEGCRRELRKWCNEK